MGDIEMLKTTNCDEGRNLAMLDAAGAKVCYTFYGEARPEIESVTKNVLAQRVR